MRFILISHRSTFKKELELLEQFLESDLSRFHLRKPKMSKAETARFIRSIDKKYHPKIVLHHHHELIEEYDLGGINFGRKSTEDPESYRREGITISKTFTTIEELAVAPDYLDYGILTPIFGSTKKRFRNKALLKEDLQAVKPKISFPIYAWGNVGEDNIEQAMDIGFDGVAIAGYIWRSAVYKKKVDRTINKFDRILKRCMHLEKNQK